MSEKPNSLHVPEPAWPEETDVLRHLVLTEREAFSVSMTNNATNVTPGIPDPDEPGRWLVRPWPVSASFCSVVQHFLMASLVGIYDECSTSRRLAYFEGYQAALSAASTAELTGTAAWQWHDELVGCVADCVAIFRARAMVEGVEGRAKG